MCRLTGEYSSLMTLNATTLNAMSRILPASRLLLIGLLTHWLLPTFLAAQVIIIPEPGPRPHPLPRPWLPPPAQAYALKELQVDASIKQQIATTQVTQVFQNTSSETIEASFIFPLPYDGAIDRLTFLVDGKEYDAKLLPAAEARRIYEEYVRRAQDPALLEWIGTGMFKTSVFPIPAGATRTVQLRYSQLLRQDARLTDYLFPLATGKYTVKPLDKLSLRVAIETAEPLKNIYSPTHQVTISRDDERHAVVQMTSSNVVPNADFRLVFDSAPGNIAASLISCWPAGEQAGYFVLLAAPDIKAGTEQPTRKTVIFVLDQSGSMSGDKIEQAREAAKFVVNNLRPDDQFNVIRYENDVSSLAPELQRFGDATRSSAIGFINGITSGGGTNIDGALTAATKMITESKTPSYIVFLTDGLPTVGEVNELKIAENMRRGNQHQSRLISFGVGYDVNARLLDRLTRENRGQSEYVRPNENIEVAVSRLFSKMSAPVLTNLQLNYEFPQAAVEAGPSVDRIYPKDVQDLFAGSQLVLIGRYRNSGQAVIRLRGQVGSTEQNLEFPVQFAAQGSGESFGFVPKLWAARRIGELIDQLDLNGRNEELIKELVELSTKHGIVTPYTSYLADENSTVRQLTDFSSNLGRTRDNLQLLDQTAGASGVGQREAKQLFKSAENLAQAAPAAADSNLSGLGGGENSAGGAGNKKDSRAPQGVRQVGNQTLYKRGKTLVAENAIQVDLEQDAARITNVKRFSAEYFELVAANTSAENQLFAEQSADEELLVQLRGKLYRIE
jgi:Ca-activated chloride channel family protein